MSRWRFPNKVGVFVKAPTGVFPEALPFRNDYESSSFSLSFSQKLAASQNCQLVHSRKRELCAIKVPKIPVAVSAFV